MPKRTPRPKSKLTHAARLSTALMERVGAMLRKCPPTDMKFACKVMQAEREAWLAHEPGYATERAAHDKDGDRAIPFVLASIAARCVEQILAHEIALKDADFDAVVDSLMAPIDGAAPAVQNDSQPINITTPCKS